VWQLKECELIRDGGSYAATLTNGTREVSLWLQIEFDANGDRRHGSLFFARGCSAAPSFPDTTLVPEGDEGAWLEALRGAVTEDVDARMHTRVAALIGILAARVP
jgi:hypothetical protein